MRIDILTVVPELLESPLSHSIVGRAISKGLVEIHVHNLRKYGKGPRQQVDDYSYGGDAGMVLMLEPVFNMIQELKAEREYDEVIYMSPDGEILNQNISNELSLKENIIILCGHYKGIDHRIREHLITREISCGDYVLSGGELPAAILADSTEQVKQLTEAVTGTSEAHLQAEVNGKTLDAQLNRLSSSWETLTAAIGESNTFLTNFIKLINDALDGEPDAYWNID